MERTTGEILGRIFDRLVGIGTYTDDLQQRVARGSILVLSSRVLIKLVQFARTVIVARMLFPEDIGLFALAAATLGVADSLVQHGMNVAIIQKDVVDRRHLDTAWTATIIRSAVVGILAFFLAPLAVPLFGTEAIVPLIQVLAVCIVIDGFVNIGTVALLIRNVQFHRKMLYDLSYVVAETLAVIIAAFVLQSVWALVIGVLVNRIASVSFSYIAHPYRPRLAFDIGAFRELFTFGKWVSVMSIVSYLIAQGDTLAVGRLLGAEAAGFYVLAFSLALIPAVDIARTLGGVLFPHLSRLAHEERGQAFLVMVRSVLLLSIPATVGLVMIGEPFVRIVYGEKWLPMLPAFYVLAAYAVLRSLTYLIEPLYWSLGRPRVVTTSSVVQLVCMIVAIVPLERLYGLPGVAGAVLIGSASALTYLLIGIRQGDIVRLRSLAFAMTLPLVASGIMGSVLMGFQYWFNIDTKSMLAFLVVVGVVAYGVALLALDGLWGSVVRSSLQWMRHNL